MNCLVKIVLVANTSWNVYNFRKKLILSFLEKGFEVICVAPEDIFTKEIQDLPVTYLPIRLNPKGNNPFSDLFLIYQLTKIYTIHKPDVVLQYTIKPNIYGSFAAYLAGVPVINTVTGLGTVFLHKTITSAIAQKLYTWSFKSASMVVFQNEDDQDLFVEKKIVKVANTRIIRGSGVDVTAFKSSTSNSDRQPFQFLMVARLIYDKGIREFAEASKMLYELYGSTVECVLIGAIDSDKNLGIPKDELKVWVDENHILYKPFTNNIVEEYQVASVVVLPSYREGLSKSLLEAASCSKPIIASNVAGCKEIVIDTKNGYQCVPKNSKDLFEKMLKMLACTKGELDEMGKFSRSLVVENFSDKIIFNEYFCLVNEVITKSIK
jgi:glycosyltransferase involved in cell wall biosynthesis